ncbi:hypothetical protein NDU88_000625 [Pleurodeles waltl]|uniref:Uncharacterized protein n=1 Tax=Pleurodeles waltl TaxID=8319 RepID=A0AAV7U560_PLEWA|nr:hypothetical protein NDU88_000625 [Pleurodeles waltl]
MEGLQAAEKERTESNPLSARRGYRLRSRNAQRVIALCTEGLQAAEKERTESNPLSARRGYRLRSRNAQRVTRSLHGGVQAAQQERTKSNPLSARRVYRLRNMNGLGTEGPWIWGKHHKMGLGEEDPPEEGLLHSGWSKTDGKMGVPRPDSCSQQGAKSPQLGGLEDGNAPLRARDASGSVM